MVNRKGIIIAAGPSTRLRPLTENLPKCMLKINGKPIIENTVELFKNNEIKDISIIKGYRKEKIDFPGITFFENDDFWNNNILHSLMYARSKLEEAINAKEEVVVSYSDILYNDNVIKKLLEDKHTISSIVDINWRDYYDGRTDHPISEAENVIVDDDKRMLKIGKHIFTDKILKNKQGEFIGLWKFTSEGIRIFLNHFDRRNTSLKKTDSFQNAKEWQKSYITDIFQEMIDQGEKLYCVLIQKNWKEFDTVQDYLRIGGEIPDDIKTKIKIKEEN